MFMAGIIILINGCTQIPNLGNTTDAAVEIESTAAGFLVKVLDARLGASTTRAKAGESVNITIPPEFTSQELLLVITRNAPRTTVLEFTRAAPEGAAVIVPFTMPSDSVDVVYITKTSAYLKNITSSHAPNLAFSPTTHAYTISLEPSVSNISFQLEKYHPQSQIATDGPKDFIIDGANHIYTVQDLPFGQSVWTFMITSQYALQAADNSNPASYSKYTITLNKKRVSMLESLTVAGSDYNNAIPKTFFPADLAAGTAITVPFSQTDFDGLPALNLTVVPAVKNDASKAETTNIQIKTVSSARPAALEPNSRAFPSEQTDSYAVSVQDLANSSTQDVQILITTDSGTAWQNTVTYALTLMRDPDPTYPTMPKIQSDGEIYYLALGGGKYDEVHFFAGNNGGNNDQQSTSAATTAYTLTISGANLPNASYLVVGGGGGGGGVNNNGWYNSGRGGNGGALAYFQGKTLATGSHAITVGRGGNGGGFRGNGGKGESSIFYGHTSGGGNGGSTGASNNGGSGTNAGSYAISGKTTVYSSGGTGAQESRNYLPNTGIGGNGRYNYLGNNWPGFTGNCGVVIVRFPHNY